MLKSPFDTKGLVVTRLVWFYFMVALPLFLATMELNQER